MDVCRICLTILKDQCLDITTTYIEDKSLAQLMEAVGQVTIQCAENLPRHVCGTCSEKLYKFHEMRKQIISTETNLCDKVLTIVQAGDKSLVVFVEKQTEETQPIIGIVGGAEIDLEDHPEDKPELITNGDLDEVLTSEVKVEDCVLVDEVNIKEEGDVVEVESDLESEEKSASPTIKNEPFSCEPCHKSFSDSEEHNCESNPLEFSEKTTEAVLDSLPAKSRDAYLQMYQQFMDWQKMKNTNSLSEDTILEYFSEISATKKSSTLWKTYSMLRTTIGIKHEIDLAKYAKLRAFLRNQSVGYEAKKSKTLTSEQIDKFIADAPDYLHLGTKAALIMGVMGACSKTELHRMKMQNLKDLGQTYLVNIRESNRTSRTFTIPSSFYDILKRYIALRPQNADKDNLFLNYQKGRCTKQVMGINKFGGMAKQVARFLQLPNFELYTGNCFRRTSIMLVDKVEAVATIAGKRKKFTGKPHIYKVVQKYTKRTFDN